ncbi:hypothetical protein [Sulfitobacter sp.]|uniref:hypothetical protein n=1 Tax=Sulfitobacter sp. TaxID=1903071 RepID=UPI0030016A9F
MSNSAIQIRPPANANALSKYHTRAAIPPDVDERFLTALSEFGQVTYAANVAGPTRRTFYNRRRQDPEFSARWDDAIEAFEETLTQRVIATALHMGTGRWILATDPDTGDIELDGDFEPLMRFDYSNVDPRIAVKLMSIRMRDLNARTAPLVAVQNNNYAAGPEVQKGEPLDLDALKAEMVASHMDTVDAEVIEDD